MERNHDPLTLRAERPADPGMMSQSMRDAVDVVLDIPPVVLEIRIPAARCRREQDIEVLVEGNPAQARADWTRDDAVDDQRPLEILHEQVAEGLRLAFQDRKSTRLNSSHLGISY